MPPPRLDPYIRSLYRLYEPLLLLHFLAPIQGPQLKTSYDSTSLLAVRRRFLCNLCFICDWTKGGPSITSIAVEDRNDGYKFWIAANEPPGERVVSFLDRVLAKLESLCVLKVVPPDAAELLARNCATEAAPRLKKEIKILQNAAKKCRGYLEADPSLAGNDTNLDSWLQQFECAQKCDLYDFCQAAYDVRNDHHVQTLEKIAKEPDDGSNSGDITKSFRAVKHFIGQMAAHIRVPTQLVEDCVHFEPLLKQLCPVRVGVVSTVACAPNPGVDAHITLDGILKRMLPAGASNFAELRSCLANFDEQISLHDSLVEMFKGKLKPRVHAEIQMLNHFYQNELKFAANDRFIACSKPACLCCSLYFRYHPGKFARPDTHQKVKIHWGPALLPEGPDDPGFVLQRDILNSMIRDIREPVLEQITNLGGRNSMHPDSISGFTKRSSDTLYDDNSSDDAALEDDFVTVEVRDIA